METKTCTKCGEVKLLELFSKCSRAKDGLRPNCKACCAAERAEYYKNNAEKVRAKSAEYFKQNSEKVCAAMVAYRKNNLEKVLAQEAEYRKNYAEKVRAKRAKDVAEMTLGYIAETLRIPVTELTPELLAMKREQLEIHRLAKQAKQLLKDYENDQGI